MFLFISVCLETLACAICTHVGGGVALLKILLCEPVFGQMNHICWKYIHHVTSAKEAMFLTAFICLSVSNIALLKKLLTDFDEIFVGNGTRNN